ncbi:MAG: regulatory protein RecX [Candidatus Kapaibacterium sp.]
MTQVIVTRVKTSPRGKCKIFIGCGGEFLVSMDLVMKFGIKSGSVIDEEKFYRMLSEQEFINVKQIAYNYASYRPRTEREVRDKLSEKGFSPDAQEMAIEFLYEFKLLDDKKFAANFIRSYLERKPSGKKRVYVELLTKGVDKYLAKSAIEECYPEDNTYTMCLAAAEKKYRSISHKQPDKLKEAMIRYLMMRGFAWDDIRMAINEVIPGQKTG